MRHIFGSLVLSSLLAACGSSDGDVDETAMLPSGPPAFVSLAEDTLELTDKYQAYFAADEIGELPTSNATYSGITAIYDPAVGVDSGYLGDFTATYDLASDTMDGQATGFYEIVRPVASLPATGVAVPGTVTMDGSPLIPGILEVTLGGTLDGGSVSGDGLALFAGPNGDLINGLVEDATAAGSTGMTVLFIGD